MILAGGGVILAGACAETRALAELLGAPVCNSYLHNDSFAASHPLAVGPLGYQGSKAAMRLISQADVVLALGTRLGPFGTLPQYGEEYWPTAAGIIQIDTCLLYTSRPMVAAAEDYVKAGYDLQAAAILLCESDGTPEEVAEEIGRMTAVLRGVGATRIEVSRDEAQRQKFWSGRKNAFPASGRMSPDYMCMDSTIPRKRLAEMLRAIEVMQDKYALRLSLIHI